MAPVGFTFHYSFSIVFKNSTFNSIYTQGYSLFFRSAERNIPMTGGYPFCHSRSETIRLFDLKLNDYLMKTSDFDYNLPPNPLPRPPSSRAIPPACLSCTVIPGHSNTLFFVTSAAISTPPICWSSTARVSSRPACLPANPPAAASKYCSCGARIY